MSNKVNKVKSTYLPVKEAEQKSDSKPDEKRKDFQKSTYLSSDLTKRNSENPTKSAFVDQNDNKTIKPDVTQRLEISNYQTTPANENVNEDNLDRLFEGKNFDEAASSKKMEEKGKSDDKSKYVMGDPKEKARPEDKFKYAMVEEKAKDEKSKFVPVEVKDKEKEKPKIGSNEKIEKVKKEEKKEEKTEEKREERIKDKKEKDKIKRILAKLEDGCEIESSLKGERKKKDRPKKEKPKPKPKKEKERIKNTVEMEEDSKKKKKPPAERRRKKTTAEVVEEDSPIVKQIQQDLDENGIPTITFKVYIEHHGGSLGLNLSSELIVTVVSGGRLAGRMKKGDLVKKINGTRVKTNEEFRRTYKLIKLPAVLIFEVQRIIQVSRFSPLRAKLHNLDENFQCEDQFITVSLIIKDRKQETVGFSLKQNDRKLTVIKVMKNKAATGLLEFGDVVIDVDGRVPSNNDKCRDYIKRGILERGFITLGVIRPMCASSIETAREVLDALYMKDYATDEEKREEEDSDEDNYDIPKVDAVIIGRMECMRRKMNALDVDVLQLKGLLHTTKTSNTRNVKMTDPNSWTTFSIHTDVEPDELEELQQVKSKAPQESEIGSRRSSKISKFGKKFGFGNLFKKG